VAISNSASPESIWGLGGPEEDHQLHHCCWTGRVSEREEEEPEMTFNTMKVTILEQCVLCILLNVGFFISVYN